MQWKSMLKIILSKNDFKNVLKIQKQCVKNYSLKKTYGSTFTAHFPDWTQEPWACISPKRYQKIRISFFLFSLAEIKKNLEIEKIKRTIFLENICWSISGILFTQIKKRNRQIQYLLFVLKIFSDQNFRDNDKKINEKTEKKYRRRF